MVQSEIQKEERRKKISRVWCLARDAGLDSEMLHLAVEGITGKESIRKLTIRQLREVEVALIKLVPKKRKKRKPKGPIYLATPDQKEKIDALLEELTPLIDIRSRTKYIEALSRRMFQKEYGKLRLEEVQKLIEALKSIIDRERKKGGNFCENVLSSNK